MFVPAGGGMGPLPLFASAAEPSDRPEPGLVETTPSAPPLDQTNPPLVTAEPVNNTRVENNPEPQAELEARPEPEPPVKPETPAKPKSQARPRSQPEPKPQPNPQPKLKPRPGDQPISRLLEPPAEAKWTPRSAQISTRTSQATPPDAFKAAPADVAAGVGKGLAHPATAAMAHGEKRSSSSGTNTEGAYLAELQRAIRRHQRYPEQARRAGREGSATLSFVLLVDGRFDQARVARSSGDPELDQAAIESLQRLRCFRPIPLELGRGSWPLSVVIRFNLQ